MVNKQTNKNKFESHWKPHSYDLVPHLNIKSWVNYHKFIGDAVCTYLYLIKTKEDI